MNRTPVGSGRDNNHVVEVVDRPVEVVECHVEEAERPVEVVDNLLVVTDSPVEVIAGRPVVMKVNCPVEVVDVAAVVGQEVPVLGGDLGVCGGHEERRQKDPTVLREVVGGESPPVDAVVNDELRGQRSKVSGFSQLPSALIDGRLGVSLDFLESSEAAIIGRYVMKGLQNSVHPMVQQDSLVIDSKVSSSLASLSSFVGSHVVGGVVKQNVQPVHSTLIAGSSV
ncbi:hypothetical protein Dimus_036399 [Dionaea muscipula]